VHDLGHGPFSHAFEKIGRRLDLKLADHEFMSDRLIREGEVAEVLNEMGRGFADDVADLVAKAGRQTVHSAVVSSQFDADRLDYMRRDRLMTGTRLAEIDFEWLIANLKVAHVPMGVDDKAVGTVATFVIGPKAVHAAEGFVLGLFQLYPTVYFHKTTRGAEKLFTELLVRVVSLAREDLISKTGLPINHPLIRFALSPEDLEVAMGLDDSVVWGGLPLMIEAEDILVSTFAKRLRDRNLYKCLDVRAMVAHAIDPDCRNSNEHIAKIDRCCAAINERIVEWTIENKADLPRILIDEAERSPYKFMGDEAGGLLDRINVQTDGGSLVDQAALQRC
jgi:HD superfamily phosphohydrolase